MENLKDKLEDLCIQFYDDGEDETSREHVQRLEAAGYKVNHLSTSGASALRVKDYESVGQTAIGLFVENLIIIKDEAFLWFYEKMKQLPSEGREQVIRNMQRYLNDEPYQQSIDHQLIYLAGPEQKMPLEEKVLELTSAEAAKGIAPYLDITVPEVAEPKKGIMDVIHGVVYWPLFAICGHLGRDKKIERQVEQMRKEKDEEEARIYKEMGLETQQEKDAFVIVDYLRIYLGKYAGDDGLSLGLSKSRFEELLTRGINSGTIGLVSPGKEVNPDFKDKAKDWLLNEVYTRASPGTRLKFLESVSLTLDESGIIYLR